MQKKGADRQKLKLCNTEMNLKEDTATGEDLPDL
jgi:hypothetical protein